MLLVLSFVSHINNNSVTLALGGKVRPYHAGNYGPRLEEITVRESKGTNKIIVIPIEGIISGDMVDRGEYSMVAVVKEELKRAREDSHVRAVILKVNSPGGEVLASDEIATALRHFQADSASQLVIVSMGSLAASGGY